MDSGLKANVLKVENVVVLMLENRSFDAILGNCYGTSEENINFLPSNKKGQFKGRYHFEEELKNEIKQKIKRDYEYPPEIVEGAASIKFNEYKKMFQFEENNDKFPPVGPGENFVHVKRQLFNLITEPQEIFDWKNHKIDLETRIKGTCNDYQSILSKKVEFERLIEQEAILSMFNDARLPVINNLAKEFAVCDEWFCSVPSQTWPNRLFLHSGTSVGIITNEDMKECVASYIDTFRQHKSVFDCMGENAQIISPNPIPLTRVLHPLPPWVDNSVCQWSQFKTRCKTEEGLKKYTFIEPQFYSTSTQSQNDQHPMENYGKYLPRHRSALESYPGFSIQHAEKLILDIYQAMFIDIDGNEDQKKRIREKRLLIILYDEHGGCFDHISPPACVVPGDKWSNEGYFKRLGVRVPAVFISPLISPHTVLRSRSPIHHFDHTSLIKSLSERWPNYFNGPPGDGPITNRTRNAESFWHVLTPKKNTENDPDIIKDSNEKNYNSNDNRNYNNNIIDLSNNNNIGSEGRNSNRMERVFEMIKSEHNQIMADTPLQQPKPLSNLTSLAIGLLTITTLINENKSVGDDDFEKSFDKTWNQIVEGKINWDLFDNPQVKRRIQVEEKYLGGQMDLQKVINFNTNVTDYRYVIDIDELCEGELIRITVFDFLSNRFIYIHYSLSKSYNITLEINNTKLFLVDLRNQQIELINAPENYIIRTVFPINSQALDPLDCKHTVKEFVDFEKKNIAFCNFFLNAYSSHEIISNFRQKEYSIDVIYNNELREKRGNYLLYENVKFLQSLRKGLKINYKEYAELIKFLKTIKVDIAVDPEIVDKQIDYVSKLKVGEPIIGLNNFKNIEEFLKNVVVDLKLNCAEYDNQITILRETVPQKVVAGDYYFRFREEYNRELQMLFLKLKFLSCGFVNILEEAIDHPQFGKIDSAYALKFPPDNNNLLDKTSTLFLSMSKDIPEEHINYLINYQSKDREKLLDFEGEIFKVVPDSIRKYNNYNDDNELISSTFSFKKLKLTKKSDLQSIRPKIKSDNNSKSI